MARIRNCAQCVLSALGVAQHDIGTGLTREPQWPESIKGSISHAEAPAIPIATRSHHILGLGVDLEKRQNNESSQCLKTQIMDDEEIQSADSLKIDFPLLFTLIFSAKESFFKAAFLMTRRFFDFHAVKFCGIDTQGHVMNFILNESLGGPFLKGKSFSIHYRCLQDNYILTLATIKDSF